METYIPVKGGSYQNADRSVGGQVFDNLYLANVEGQGKVDQVATPTQGYALWRSVITSNEFKQIRGGYYSTVGVNGTSTLYVSTGDAVYRVTQTGNFFCGNITQGSTRVRFADNGFDLVVVDGVMAYKLDLFASDLTASATWSTIALPTINGTPIKPSNIVFSKQRLIIDSGKNQFFYSELASTTFSQLNFYSAESKADYIKSMGMIGDNLLILGSRSVEMRDTNIPMESVSGGVSDIGIMATDSLAIISDRAYFLGGSDSGRFTVFALSNIGNPERISDDGLEYALSKLEQPEAGQGFCFYDAGHTFYVLNFIHDKKTFVYDESTKAWHTRSNVNVDTGARLAWQPAFIVSAYGGKLIAGSGNSEELFEVSSDIYTHGTQPIIRTWITPIIWDNLKTIQLRFVQVDISAGTTKYLADNGEGNVNPKLMARFSRDAGYTYGEQEERRLGKQGEYSSQPPLFSSFGFTRSLVGQFIISAGIMFTIKGLKIKYAPTRFL